MLSGADLNPEKRYDPTLVPSPTRPSPKLQGNMVTDFWRQKSCVVTGASSGLGWKIAQILAQRGARLSLAARRTEPLEQVAEKLRQTGAQVQTVAADLAWQQDVDRVAQQVQAAWGQVDMLCHCAGRSARGEILDTSPEDFQQLLDINFLAPVRLIRALAPLLIRRKGHVILIGSLASHIAPRYMGGYPASKFALAAYAQQLRLELGPLGLHVLHVCPGPFQRDPNEPSRYQDAQVPEAARRPGAGANVRATDIDWLARKILAACQQGRAELVVPRRARLLFALSRLWPSVGDWALRRSTSGKR